MNARKFKERDSSIWIKGNTTPKAAARGDGLESSASNKEATRDTEKDTVAAPALPDEDLDVTGERSGNYIREGNKYKSS